MSVLAFCLSSWTDKFGKLFPTGLSTWFFIFLHTHAHAERRAPSELSQSSANLASSIRAPGKRLGGEQTVQTLNRSNIKLHLCHTVAGPRHTSTKYSRIIPLHQTETWWHQCGARMKDGGPVAAEGCKLWKDSSVNRRQPDRSGFLELVTDVRIHLNFRNWIWHQ